MWVHVVLLSQGVGGARILSVLLADLKSNVLKLRMTPIEPLLIKKLNIFLSLLETIFLTVQLIYNGSWKVRLRYFNSKSNKVALRFVVETSRMNLSPTDISVCLSVPCPLYYATLNHGTYLYWSKLAAFLCNIMVKTSLLYINAECASFRVPRSHRLL